MPTLHVSQPVQPSSSMRRAEGGWRLNRDGALRRRRSPRRRAGCDRTHPYAKLHLAKECSSSSFQGRQRQLMAVDLDAAVRRAEAAEKALEEERALTLLRRAK